MKHARKRAGRTRSFYAFEDKFMPRGRELRTEGDARRVAARVWQWARSLPRYRKRARRWGVPEVVFGPGFKQGKRHLSYCWGYLYIELSPEQRCMTVLLHELVHALGPITHGKRFEELYLTMTLQFLE